MRDHRPLVLTLFGVVVSALAVATFDLGERFDRFAEQHKGWRLREILITAALAAFVTTIVAVVEGHRLRHAAVRQDSLEAELRYQALHDPLTGLANRTLVIDRIEHALARTKRNGGVVGVAFMDLDHFKAINDEHGHAYGDEQLRRAAVALARGLRQGDTVGRFGGDEFALMCEAATAPEAMTIVERARRQVVSDDPRQVLSASAGLAVSGAATTAEDLLAAADRALYSAKANGRARTTLAEGVHGDPRVV